MTASVPPVETGSMNVRIPKALASVGLLAALLACLCLAIVQGMAGSVVLGAQPERPQNISPLDGDTGVSLTPTLESSAFIGKEPSDNHTMSHWRITILAGDYSSPVINVTDNVSLTEITIDSGVLIGNTLYYWQVRHQDNHGAWSDWSIETSFTTLNHAPDQPVNALPINGASEVSLNPILQSSLFSDSDTGDTHAASQWRISAVSYNYSSPVFDSGTDNFSLVSIAVPSGFLSDNITYYWQVRHQDNHGAWSDWSIETSFTTLNHPPVQPTNLLPDPGAEGVILTATLESSAFSDPDFGDTHAASQWQITTVPGDYSSPVFDSETDNVNLTHIVTAPGVLSDNVTYYWQVRHQDNHGAWSEWSQQTSFTTENRAPNPPLNEAPVDGAEEVSLNPELLSSAFSDPDLGDTHAASRWRITSVSDNYSSPVFDSGTDNVSLVSIAVPSGFLSDNVTYYWQVRHQDNHGAWSDWSSQTSFTTLNHAPSKPVNALPNDGASEVSLNPTLESSAFSDPDFGDTHAASQWQITTVPGDYSNPVFDSGTDNVSLTQIVVVPGVLTDDVIYYWQVRHQDNHGAWSEWSEETSFETLNHAPSQPDVVSPADGAMDVTIPVTLNSSAFADPDDNDTHAASRWQITKAAGDYSDPICDLMELKNGGLTSITVDLGVLNPGTTYYWRVQHQDNHGEWSAWSAEASFTPQNQPPAKPAGLSPTPGATAVSLTPLLKAVFSDPDGPQDYLASQWQITVVAGNYESTIYDHVSQRTSITVPDGILNTSTTYYWRVKHQDRQQEWSEWSDEASFTTRPVVPPIKEGGIPLWVWIIVGMAATAIVVGLVVWRLRAAK